MDFDQSDWIVTLLLVILGVSVLIAVIVIAKAFANNAKENKAREARLAAEEKNMSYESQTSAQAKLKLTPKPVVARAPAKKDDVDEGDDLVAAAEVYLTYELKEQAIISLEKHLLKNPTDKKALDLLKKAEASK